jgi:hypothetical protein
MRSIFKKPNKLLEQLKFLLDEKLYTEYVNTWFKIIKIRMGTYKECFTTKFDGCKSIEGLPIINEQQIDIFLSMLQSPTYYYTGQECNKLYFYKCVLYPSMYIILKHVLELVFHNIKSNTKYNISMLVLYNLFIGIPLSGKKVDYNSYKTQINTWLSRFYDIKYTIDIPYTIDMLDMLYITLNKINTLLESGIYAISLTTPNLPPPVPTSRRPILPPPVPTSRRPILPPPVPTSRRPILPPPGPTTQRPNLPLQRQPNPLYVPFKGTSEQFKPKNNFFTKLFGLIGGNIQYYRFNHFDDVTI